MLIKIFKTKNNAQKTKETIEMVKNKAKLNIRFKFKILERFLQVNIIISVKKPAIFFIVIHESKGRQHRMQ